MEDVFLARLEFLVDVGVLSKLDSAKYIYAPSERLDALATLLAELGGAQRGFFGFVALCFERPSATRLREPQQVLDHLREAHDRLRGITGYSLITNATVLANLSTWQQEPWIYVELADALDALQELARGERPSVRVISDRFRRPNEFTVLGAR
jgi:hypothetical protein